MTQLRRRGIILRGILTLTLRSDDSGILCCCRLITLTVHIQLGNTAQAIHHARINSTGWKAIRDPSAPKDPEEPLDPSNPDDPDNSGEGGVQEPTEQTPDEDPIDDTNDTNDTPGDNGDGDGADSGNDGGENGKITDGVAGGTNVSNTSTDSNASMTGSKKSRTTVGVTSAKTGDRRASELSWYVGMLSLSILLAALSQRSGRKNRTKKK